jgi:hypothetical protein
MIDSLARASDNAFNRQVVGPAPGGDGGIGWQFHRDQFAGVEIAWFPVGYQADGVAGAQGCGGDRGQPAAIPTDYVAARA